MSVIVLTMCLATFVVAWATALVRGRHVAATVFASVAFSCAAMILIQIGQELPR